MKINRKKVILVVVILVLVSLVIGGYFTFRSPWKFRESGPIKIVWIDSYHEDYFWSMNQIEGFRNFLDDSGMDYEIEIFHMNSKVNSSGKEKREAGKRAAEFIEEQEPDLIYLTDDNAQIYVGMNYVNSKIPIVFSGINGEPELYNYDKANNVAGVLERTPLMYIIALFRNFYPMAERGVVIGDDSETGIALRDELKNASKNIDEFDFIGFENPRFFSEYKSRIEYYQGKSDVIILTALHTIKRDTGEIIPLSEIIEWTVKNSEVPEIYIIEEGIQAGAFLTISVSPYEHGRVAAELVYNILIFGENPSSFDFIISKNVNRFLNLARAEDLGLGDKEKIVEKIFNFEGVGQEDFSLVFEPYKFIEEYPWEELE